MKHCAVCNAEVNEDNADILTMGRYGNPRYLCPHCSERFSVITESRDSDEIARAMAEISDALSAVGCDDTVVFTTVTGLLDEAKKRRQMILDGSLPPDDELPDEESDGIPDEIPEELRETEEDRALDEKEAEEAKKLDRWMNLAWILVVAAAAVFILCKFILK